MAAAAVALDEDMLPDAAATEALLQCVPTPDEALLLEAYRRNDAALTGLADAELFALNLLTVRDRIE